MSTGDQDTDPSASSTIDEAAEDATPAQAGAEPKQKLALEISIDDTGPCKKHLKVAIAKADVERQFQTSLGEIKREAVIPGFRPGHAPKRLVERRFRKEVAGKVKAELLKACMEQIDEEYELNTISQPNLDLEAIELPDDGPMRFEMDIEVQPDFPLPDYKSLTIKRPVKTITEADVDDYLKSFLERHAQMVPKLEGGGEIGDFITADLKFDRDGTILNEVKELQFRLQPELRFQDGYVPNLGAILSGVRPGDVREAVAHIGTSSAAPSLRGQTIRVTFNVLDLKRLRLPEVDTAFLERLGFVNLKELRAALREILARRLQFQIRHALRRQILDKLIEQTPFDLPADLVARQEKATLRRQFMEMREGGLSDEQIRAREAELRANAHEATLKSLKEFFILSKIADSEDIKINDEDMEMEIEAIASRSDESPRRVRARIEKEELGETLAMQVLERKTIDQILRFVKFEEVPLAEEPAVETLDQSAAPAPPETEDKPEEDLKDNTGEAAGETPP